MLKQFIKQLFCRHRWEIFWPFWPTIGFYIEECVYCKKLRIAYRKLPGHINCRCAVIPVEDEEDEGCQKMN